jgi:hypothetical protein
MINRMHAHIRILLGVNVTKPAPLNTLDVKSKI